MNKQTEIQILREAADRLGSDSYCGPWLRQQIAFVESAIRSDFFPDVDLNRSREVCAEEARRCAAECDALRAKAKQDAEQIMAKAREDACAIRGRVLNEIRKCQSVLGVSF